jgi:amino acid adenylation domain-containing protein
MFAWQSTVETGPELAGAEPERAERTARRAPQPDAAKFDLALTLRETGRRIIGSLTYATALFDDATAHRHLDYLRRVLEAMAANDAQRVAALRLLADDECREVVTTWNATAVAFPRDGCLHELFEAHAARSPDAVAIVHAGQSLSYAALDQRANRLAHHLRALGVRPDVRVAVCLERSPDMVVALMAVLKAGGAYVPLDPAHPPERLRFMLADSQARVLIAHAPSEALLADLGDVTLADVDAAVIGGVDLPDTGPRREAIGLRPEHLAYVIYTSGSTGRPKGVMIAHENVCNQILGLQKRWGITPHDRLLQFASVTFDVSVEELFLALLSGSALVLREDAWLDGAQAFWGACEAHRVSFVNVPTRFWQVITHEATTRVARCVRLLIVGGEAIDSATLAEWFESEDEDHPAAGPLLFNAYGPTETTINATLQPLDASPSEWRSIGQPLANTRVYVLDVYGEPVPVGVAGELYVGGAGVARGYLGRPALTAERFIADAFGEEPGARLYRTGDMARWLPGGRLEFLGRADFQVKIRGYRIELGEIEARLGSHPAVRDAVVVARAAGTVEHQLIAYWVGDPGLDPNVLRAHLAAALPAYMVPAAYVRLETLQLTPSGKVDRRALPAPTGDAFGQDEYEAPQDETETRVAAVWADVLRVDRVGRTDNFFELGGHSLAAIRAIAQLKHAGIDVRVADMFAFPTVESLSARALGLHRPPSGDAAIPVRVARSGAPLFLVHDGFGSVDYVQVLAPHVGADCSLYALPAPPADGPVIQTIEAMSTRLVRMIRAVRASGPYRVAGWSFGGLLAYEMAVQLIAEGELVEFVGLIDPTPPGLFSVSQPVTTEAESLLAMLRAFARGTPERRARLASLASTADETDLESLLTRCRELSLLPPHLSSEYDGADWIARVRSEVAQFRAREDAADDYSPAPTSAPLHTFVAQIARVNHQRNEWRELLSRTSVELITVPGTHFSMMHAPHVAVLGRALTEAMRQARQTRAAVT